MSLDTFRTLGRSGLVVSPQTLGTMTFGQEAWGADEETSREIFNAYRRAGGNFVDTADVYSGGRARGWWAASSRRPARATRSCWRPSSPSTRLSSPLAASDGARGNPNAGGAGAKNIHRALEASLKRLGTDYVDLYWMHIWDGVTPVEEIVQTLGDLVRAGKIRYFGLSDMPAWLAMKAATIAAERRTPGPIAIQVEYSLVARDVEVEHIPAAREAGIGVMPWSPLAGGLLTGKYRREDTSGSGRLSGTNPFGTSKFTDRNWDVLDVVKAVAAEIGRAPAQVALAWVMARPGVASTILGASKLDQLQSNIAATEIALSEDQLARLTEASTAAPGFSAGLTSPAIRRMVFGGNGVTGWGEYA